MTDFGKFMKAHIAEFPSKLVGNIIPTIEGPYGFTE